MSDEAPAPTAAPAQLTVPISDEGPSSPYGGSPERAKKSQEVEHTFDDSLDYMGLDKRKVFEMIERRSPEILQQLGGRDAIADQIKVDTTKGISASEVAARQTSFGINVLNKKEPVTFWEFFVEACSDKIVIILAVAAVVSIVLGMTVANPHTGQVELESGWIEGTAIIISICVVTLTGSINNYQKALQFEEMEKEQSIKQLNVKRDGEKTEIESDTLVVGDLLYLSYGMQLSADGLIIEAADLRMNESAITGEPDLIEKDPHEEPFILSGTAVEEGTGLMLVVGVGMNSFQGHLKKSLDEESGDTPLQEHLSELADQIGYVGFALAFILVAALMIKEGIMIEHFGKAKNGANFLNFFLIAVTLIVVAIPEGLPLAVTIALAFAMKAMMDDECMVRVLASCETMGAATAVCSDKTGTLTTNQMTCVQGCIGGEEFVIDGYGLTARHEGVHVADRDKFELRSNKEVEQLFAFSVSVNSDAYQDADKEGVLHWRGNRTEVGMLKLLMLMNVDFMGARAQYPHSDHARIRQFPFNSKKKRMTTIIKEDSGSFTMHVKGASETILEDCDFYMDTHGQVTHMTEDARSIYNDVIEDIAKQGNRTIGVACLQDMQFEGGVIPKDEPEVRLVFLGVMGIQDPIRKEVPPSVLRSHSAGLCIRMCTGDNIITAVSIAKKCHIFEDNGWDIAMLGTEFAKMYENEDTREQLKDLIPRLKVLARSSPHDKYILVKMLQEQGEVVGVTGDGTNDAPALKLADVGFAMKTGTDIAKGASDMVLLDDNFATVVTAIKWGRAVNDNIKKFLQFQLTINVSGVMLTLIASLISESSKEPFTPVQLLWLNLIMDTLAALSLATELPEESSLDRQPSFKESPLISRRMWCFIGIHGTWQFVLILVLMLVGHKWFRMVEGDISICGRSWPTSIVAGKVVQHNQRIGCDKLCTDDGGHTDTLYNCQQGPTHSTFLFNVFIWTQVFNVVNARKVHGEWNPLEGLWDRSKQLLIIFTFIAGLQAIAVELFGKFMSTSGLSGTLWGASIGIAAITIVIGMFERGIQHACIEDEIPDSVVEHRQHIEELRKEVELQTKNSATNNEPTAEQ